MKKLLFITVLLILTFIFTIGLVGCKVKTHEHTYATEWSVDSTHHWHKATCEHADEVKDKAKHNFDTNGKCRECGYDTPGAEHKHSFSDSWTSDETYHWNAATCEHKNEVQNKAVHDFDGLGICRVCEYMKPQEQDLELLFTLNDDETGYIVSGLGENSDNVNKIIIPSNHGGKPVVGIADRAFMGNTAIEYVHIPESVKTIGEESFRKCVELKSVNLPKELEVLDGFAFCECPQLSGNLIIPHNIEEIIKYTFYNCSFDSIEFASGSKCKIIGDYAFAYNGEVNSIQLPSVITKIGAYAFRDSSDNVSSVTIPESVTTVGEYVFYSSKLVGRTTIRCEVSAKPSDWAERWDTQNPIVYDCNRQEVAHDGYIYFVADNGIRYAIKDGVAAVAHNLIGISGNIELPSAVTYKNISYDVTQIGESAFRSCEKLKGITIADSVNEIGNRAFYKCSSLSYVSLPKESRINVSVFEGCKSLKTIKIPIGITYIGYDCFKGCDALSIECDARQKPAAWSENWNRDNRPVKWGILIENSQDDFKYVEQDGQVYLTEYIGTATEVTIPNNINGKNVVSIGGIFSGNKSITKVILPDGLKAIEGDAFSECSKLANVVLPDSLTTIDEYAFYKCTALKSIIIPESVKTVRQWAFDGCKLESITMAAAHVGSVQDKSALKSATVTVGEEISKDAFKGAANLTSVTLPDSIKLIDGSAFKGCSKLLQIKMPSSLTKIAESAFSSCSALTEVVFPEGLIELGNNAFSYCSSLTKVVLPNTLQLYDRAFVSCNKLQYNKYDNAQYLGSLSNPYIILVKAVDKTITSCKISDRTKFIGVDAFFQCRELKSIAIPDGVIEICYNAFSSCSALASFSIPKSVVRIGNRPLAFCKGLTSSTVDKANTVYHSEGNCLIDTKNKLLIAAAKNCVIPTDGSVAKIGAYTFSSMDIKGNFTVPSVITEIGDNAFANCTSLTGITVPGSVVDIKSYAFDGCTALEDVTLAEGIQNLSSNVFSRCTAIEKIVMPSSIKTIGQYAFYNCSNLKTIVLSKNIKTIPNYTFSGCNALEKVYYLGTAEEWKKVKVTGNADFIAVARYYYSEQTPADTQNKYWRFASDGKSIVEW